MAKITLPQLSEGADSGTVVSIFVQPGDTIEKNQTILELENDKAVAPIPADKAGTVQEIHVNEGDEINVGDLLLTLDTTGKGEKPAEKPAEQPKKEESQKEEQADEEMETPASIQDSVLERQYQSKSGFPPPASPTIRRMAKTIGLDLTKVPGSKKGGRIVMDDIKKYIHQLQSMQAGKGKQPTAEKEKSQP
ncbi:biotin/lipoyl-binding protein, partial [bacterium]|nr:biotin/lipoyl-binding protein [bacterium]